MKKHLVPFLATGLACVAHAQSSVTLFGVVDATFTRGTGSVSDRTQLSRGGLTSNRFGLRGVEDLGGGLSAGFWLEGGFNVDDGTIGTTSTNNQTTGSATGMFGRRSTVSLSGQWGEVRLGRDLLPQYRNLVDGDVFGNVGVGTSINYQATIATPVQVRASNMVQYLSPKWGNVSLNVGHYRGENPSGTPTADDGTGTGLRLSYAAEKFSVAIGASSTAYATGDITQRNINGQWNAGFAKLVATYGRDRAGATRARGGSVGMVVPVGPGNAKIGYSQYQITTGAVEREAKKLAIGYVHNLSKRTAVYGTLARIRNSGGANFALNGAATGANRSSSGVDIGLSHSF